MTRQVVVRVIIPTADNDPRSENMIVDHWRQGYGPPGVEIMLENTARALRHAPPRPAPEGGRVLIGAPGHNGSRQPPAAPQAVPDDSQPPPPGDDDLSPGPLRPGDRPPSDPNTCPLCQVRWDDHPRPGCVVPKPTDGLRGNSIKVMAQRLAAAEHAMATHLAERAQLEAEDDDGVPDIPDQQQYGRIA